jgi:hypothetical protein
MLCISEKIGLQNQIILSVKLPGWFFGCAKKNQWHGFI